MNKGGRYGKYGERKRIERFKARKPDDKGLLGQKRRGEKRRKKET